MRYFPACLRLSGRRIVIAGGNAAAAQKARLFAAAGAELLIIAEIIEPAFKAEFGRRAVLLERAPRAEDFIAADIAVIVDARRGPAALADAARAKGALVNVVDRPDISDFIVPSIIDRGDVIVAISTAGAAPVLARRLRRKIEEMLPARLGALAGFARSFRAAVAGKFPPPARRKFWERVFEGPIAAQVLAGEVRAAREKMIESINAPQYTKQDGVVHIVGAGPGDPELLTLRAHRLLQEADVILYDRLVGEGVLGLARRDAERVYVGKTRGGRAAAQAEINRRLIDSAQQGKTVVRLKGGDPFIFGRGGEELDALRAAGIRAFVTPGVTAATGCAAAAGMALTHRDYAHGLTLVAGHAKDGGDSDLDWTALARLRHTLVFYMGVSSAATIAGKLISHGLASSTPVAVIENGGLADQKILKGLLKDLAALIENASVGGPALIVIGETAALADTSAHGLIIEPHEKRRAA